MIPRKTLGSNGTQLNHPSNFFKSSQKGIVFFSIHHPISSNFDLPDPHELFAFPSSSHVPDVPHFEGFLFQFLGPNTLNDLKSRRKHIEKNNFTRIFHPFFHQCPRCFLRFGNATLGVQLHRRRAAAGRQRDLPRAADGLRSGRCRCT